MAAFAVLTFGIALLITLGPIGCTAWAAKKNPRVFQDTTSAEQYTRIFWRDVRDQRWKNIQPVLATNIVYTASGKALAPDQVIPFLQSLEIRDFLLSNVVVKPNGADMTLSYNLQIQQPNHPPESLVVLSVWQHVRHGLILTAQSQQPAAKSIQPR